MTAAFIWLIKLVLSHLVTDFILQPKTWVNERITKHFASPRLYIHGFVTAFFACLLIGIRYWPVVLILLVTHILIDGWKSYQKQNAFYFIVDQSLHLLVILACWYYCFFDWSKLLDWWRLLEVDIVVWKTITAFVFVTNPAAILIGQLTKKWRDKLPEAENLASAGKWIGIMERIIILIFVLNSQYSAIGLLIAAKGIIRFNEKDRQEIKTEYLVIGTLMSIALAIGTGIAAKI
jgi:hypothetical protein